MVAIDCSASHCLALRLDGTVAAWLDNSSWNPKPPNGLNGVAAIGAGYSYSYAIRTNGTVVGWNSCSIPPDLTNVIAVTGGNDDMAALFDDGSLKMWYRTGYLIPPRAPAPVGLSNSVAMTSGYHFHAALGPNVPPQARSLSVTGAMSKDLVITLPLQDPNGDQVNIRIPSLPAAGSLFQYTPAGVGAEITTPGTVIEDLGGHVIFVPAASTSGMPYASFTFAGSDGELDSSIGTITVNILPSPVLIDSGLLMDSNGVSFNFSFEGLTNAIYSIWASTNLPNWTYLRTAIQSTPGLFYFSDQITTNRPVRFYRVSSP